LKKRPEKLIFMPCERWPPSLSTSAGEGVAGFHEGHESCLVGLRAGVGLHVGELAAEHLLGALDGEVSI
jgi:hypothetical protein